MAAPYIEYWDTGKVAREKINSIIDEVNASIPSIGENWHRYIGGVDTGYIAVGFEVRATKNLIKIEGDTIYTDLLFADNLAPTSGFDIGVTVGNVTGENGRPVNGLLLNCKTETSYTRTLYGTDGNIYFDRGNGTFKRIATTDYVDNAIASLRESLHQVAFTGKSSDLINDAGFNSVPVLTAEEYEEIPDTSTDNKRYFIYDLVNE